MYQKLYRSHKFNKRILRNVRQTESDELKLKVDWLTFSSTDYSFRCFNFGRNIKLQHILVVKVSQNAPPIIIEVQVWLKHWFCKLDNNKLIPTKWKFFALSKLTTQIPLIFICYTLYTLNCLQCESSNPSGYYEIPDLAQFLLHGVPSSVHSVKFSAFRFVCTYKS